jgi:FAD/FMN-containing dehydrogenase
VRDDPIGELFDRARSDAFERRSIALRPGEIRAFVPSEWADALVVVRAGEVELRSTGCRVRLVSGDVACFATLRLRALRNPGRVSALLDTVRRRPGDDFGPRRGSHRTTTREDRTMSTPMISISDLRSRVRGRVIGPDDHDYDAARAVFYGGLDRRPAAVVRVADERDVASVIALARDVGLEVAVRSGGHSAAGHGTSEGGLVIDLAELREIDIDPGARLAGARTGLTAAAYSVSAGEHGLATGFGDTGSVGIGGITLGGGVGYLVRKHGLTIDDLLAADVVTADGELIHVDQDTHPDLFWAIRGGGGNFGVATRFTLRLHEMPQVLGGMLLLPATAETVEAFLDAATNAPEELSAIVNVMPAPPMPFVPEERHGTMAIFALLCFAGDPADGERAMAPLRSVAPPLADMVRPMPYPEIYPPEDAAFHPIAASATTFVDNVDGAAIGSMLEALERSDAMLRAVQIRPLGGAMARVPNDATAFAHRDRRFMINVAALYADPNEGDRHEAWVAALSGDIQRGPRASYVNFLVVRGAEDVRMSYPGPTWDRLREIKARYDPNNVFRVNHNIPPAAG